jgi:hypothetical protein
VSTAVVQVRSVSELRRIEAQAVARLNERPRSAQLFTLDPVGALATVGIVLSPEAVVEWSRLIGSPLPAMPSETRELVADSSGADQFTVRIEGILPPEAGVAPAAGRQP